jgi:hypothetical protein
VAVKLTLTDAQIQALRYVIEDNLPVYTAEARSIELEADERATLADTARSLAEIQQELNK